ncbi:MAG TPA: Smr/MutS family protein [Burkholderiales bacterium]|nr:Smr/MutS family protein [Burkholderiales bacterium]
MPKPSNPPIPEAADEETLLREALRDVAPLPDTGKARLDKARPAPLPVQRLRDDEQVLADSLSDELPLEPGLETGEELVFLRPGLPAQLLRKLKRGDWSVQDELDLHGARTDEARALFTGFLSQSLKRGLRCVRLIHGKGLRSAQGEPVLKRKVGRWLSQRDEVLAFVQARPEDGGGGAVVVLLKAKGKRGSEA